MTNPTLIQRPAGVTPEAWARASWYARLRLVNARAAANRADRNVEPARPCVAERYAADVEVLIATGHTTLAQVAAALGRTPETVRARLMSASRPDLVATLRGQS